MKHNCFHLRKASEECFQQQSTNALSLKLKNKISLTFISVWVGQTAGVTLGYCCLLRSPWLSPLLCIGAICRLVADYKTSFCRAKSSQSGAIQTGFMRIIWEHNRNDILWLPKPKLGVGPTPYHLINTPLGSLKLENHWLRPEILNLSCALESPADL